MSTTNNMSKTKNKKILNQEIKSKDFIKFGFVEGMEEHIQSNKNTLQEYYQKHCGSDGKHILPDYDYERTMTGWLCILTLPDSKEFRAAGRNKKLAAQTAAGKALDVISALSTKPSSPHIHNPTANKALQWFFPGCLLVLIDLENAPKHDKERWNRVRWDCCRIEAFVGKMSSHATKDLKALYPFVTHFHIVNSAHRDAVDHAISVRAGEWVESMKHYLDREEGCLYDDAIYIVSRDRFAPALVDILRQKVPLSDIDLVHCININECFEYLENHATQSPRVCLTSSDHPHQPYNEHLVEAPTSIGH